MSLRGRRLLWLIVAAGTVLRLVVAVVADTSWIDIDSLSIVNRTLDHGVLDFYDNLADEDRWPYPPGYLPVVMGLDGLASLSGIGFERLVRVVPILADAGVVLVVQHLIGRRGGSETARLAGAAAVAFGPVFIGVSGYQAQIDAVAILPALAAFAVWERGGERRALGAGLLIGLGASIKTVPLLMLLALAPWARSRREALTLVAVAAALPLAALAPFLLTSGAGDVLDHLRYRGFAGLGGLSLIAQPDVPVSAIGGGDIDANGALRFLFDAGSWIVAAAIAATAALIARRRPPPLEAAVILWLVVWLFGVNFFLQYLVWGLPFLIVAGELRRAVQIQLLALPALVVFYARPDGDAVIWLLYTLPVLSLWALFAAMLGGRVRAAAANRTSSGSTGAR